MGDDFQINHFGHSQDCCDVTFKCYKDSVTVNCFNEHEKKALACQLMNSASVLLGRDHEKISEVLQSLKELLDESC